MNATTTPMMELPAEALSAATARRLVAGAARGVVCFTERDVDDLCVAVGEAFANAVRHGVADPSAAIRFGVELKGRSLRVMISYPSAPFNTAPTVPEPEELATGGYGLHLMRMLADVVDFRFENGTACLRLEKHCRTCPK